ncbi:MAG: transcription-repair coupling factor [Dethiobacter sp.]|nr:MAG: transcription-repair coupling factor [Dethiobacter sp.]
MPYNLLEKWQEDPSFVSLQSSQLRASARLVTGLEGSQRSFLIAALFASTPAASLVLTSDTARAERLFEEIKGFLPADEVYLFPGKDFFYTGEVLTQSREILQQRLKVLERLALKKRILVIAPVAALLGKLTPAAYWRGQHLAIKAGTRIEWKSLLGKFVEMGYERADLTESEGSFSVRGDIVDIFPFHTTWPVRISFFDEEVETLNYFDPESQRSLEPIASVSILPAHEVILSGEALQQGGKILCEELEKVTKQLKSKKQEEAADRLRTRVENHLAKLGNSGHFEGLEQYISYFYPEPAALTDYFPEKGLLFWDDPENVVSAADSLLKELQEYQAGLLLQGDILPGQVEVCWNLREIVHRNNLNIIALTAFSRNIPYVMVSSAINIQARLVPSFMGRLDLLQEELKSWWSQGYEVLLMCDGEKRAGEMERLLTEHGLTVSHSGEHQVLLRMTESERELSLDKKGEVIAFPVEKVRGGKKAEKIIKITTGRLENGFIIPSLGLVILVDKEILPAQRKKKRWATTRGTGSLREFQELKTGDLVVHEQHGIGRYMGIRTMEVDGVTRDYLYIKYAGEDKLYLPVDQIDFLQRYVGGDGRPPKVSSLGGQEWVRIKNRVKASVQDLARELLSLYAAREATTGYAFSADHAWQLEFEDRFPYEETQDQLRAIQEAKADMENSRPMDRLLCGDVGYGKTEVALRAAFKAITDGKQVAFLVPTTILAQQHYENFLERFKGFPVQVELLSRFRSAKEQKRVIKGLKAGVIDIVVGTHRLISKDIEFKDLGLLVIDEEHRFGVRHKEKLKMFRQEVDVLSMTATPIPRTLHMALSGARDLSVIDTPPENRYPVQTYVVEYSDSLIKEAIQRELNRGGQVYFIYNRVRTIEKWAARLRELIPEAKIIVAHGQMPEQELSEVMHKFLHREYDLLVSTTIVEAGLDIPNVNTMVVYDADHFGLAQLYQLRGRVGRSNRLAYCYLTYRKDKVMTEDAVKRLQAIKEFTDLGSGFKIALRDLEIRGAGNMLGPEQHGYMMAVGYELYCRLLDQAIETMKGKKPGTPREFEPRIDLNINAYLPSSYVTNQQQKIELYRRIATLENREELRDMVVELKDRYGRLQPPVENLLLVMRLRQLARQKGVESIEQQKNQTIIKFQKEKNFQSEQLWQLVSRYRRNLSLHAGKGVSLKIKDLEGQEKQYLKFLIQILEEVS